MMLLAQTLPTTNPTPDTLGQIFLPLIPWAVICIVIIIWFQLRKGRGKVE